MLLQGSGVEHGVFNVVPGARSPITISINLPIPNPTREIESPNFANIQAAVESLKAEADDYLTIVPSNFTHTTEVVDSLEEASFFFDLDLDYSGPIVSAGLGVTFDAERSHTHHTYALKHIEELYTISFSDDVYVNVADFFADDFSEQDAESLSADGFIGDGNPLTYVRSVTYGRMILATAEVDQALDSSEFEATVNAGAYGVTVDSELRNDYLNMASSAAFNLLAVGGSTAEAAAALAGGQVEDIFGPARAATAAPLYYRIHFAEAPRPVARTGDTTTYVEQDCRKTRSEPCENVCGDAWARVDESSCTMSTSATGTWYVIDGQAPSGGFTVPAQIDATRSRVCVRAYRTLGGLWCDDSLGVTVSCGSQSRSVSRRELWNGCASCGSGDYCGGQSLRLKKWYAQTPDFCSSR